MRLPRLFRSIELRSSFAAVASLRSKLSAAIRVRLRLISPVFDADWRIRRRALALLAAAGWLVLPAGAGEVTLAIDRVEAPGFAASGIAARLRDGAPGALQLMIGELSVQGKSWRNVRAGCGRFRVERARIECLEGEADLGGKVPLAFTYDRAGEALDLALTPAPGETWRVRARFGKRSPELRVEIENGALSRLGPWLPPAWPRITAGMLSGAIRLTGAERERLAAEIAVRDAAFSDAAGLHAAENLGARLDLTAERRGESWQYRAALEWNAGELFWQPLYLRGTGHTLEAEGALDERQATVVRGRLRLAGVGEAEASGEWDRRTNTLLTADARSGRLDASALYAQVLKPFFFGTALGELRAEGSAELAVRWRGAQLEALDVVVRELSFEDRNRRFAVFGASGRIPWHRSDETRVEVEMKGGELLRVPFGAVKVPLTMRGMRFRLDTVEVPLLDGTLSMRAFATEPPQEGWRWAFRGGISPVSMERLTQAVGLPTMHGTVSAEIPRVTYARSTLRADGALVFKVFDGTVTAKNVTLIEPFGRAPRLAADLEMRGVDLDLLTRTFSFGSITGRIDASVTGLELANWAPVRFDARVRSSPGDYPRRISQRAVENITALGGAGAGAAIQGTFLRFFDQFGYAMLGLSCRLENGVCTMGGVEDAPQGYVIVKGGGVPALSVLGYNRAVDWHELIDRLKRVVQDNVRMIVR